MYRFYNINYIDIHLYNKININDDKSLMRNLDKKFNKYFQIHLEKIAIVNYNLKSVLKTYYKPYIHNNNFIHIPINTINRYKLSFIKMKKFIITEYTEYDLIVSSLNNKFFV